MRSPPPAPTGSRIRKPRLERWPAPRCSSMAMAAACLRRFRRGRLRGRSCAMAPDFTARLVDAAVAVIRDNAEELTQLDRAIGDGDHGINMKRGFEAVAEAPEIRGLPLGDALQKLGMTLVMK